MCDGLCEAVTVSGSHSSFVGGREEQSKRRGSGLAAIPRHNKRPAGIHWVWWHLVSFYLVGLRK